MQIYRNLDIGTAKPTKEEMGDVVHHMIDVADPTETFSVERYCTMAHEIIRDIYSRGHLPIMVGGTGLYADNTVYATTFSAPVRDEALSGELLQYAQIHGNEALFKILEKEDPEKAKTLDELGLSDSRIIKFFLNGTTLSKAVRCVEEDEYYGLKYIPYIHEDYSGTKSEDVEENEREARKNDAYTVSINTPRKLRYKRDPGKDHFYIPERKKYHASVRFDIKGTNPLSLLILAAVYIVLGLIFIRIFPSLLKAIDTAIGAFKGF
jgi:hypothetical protein